MGQRCDGVNISDIECESDSNQVQILALTTIPASVEFKQISKHYSLELRQLAHQSPRKFINKSTKKGFDTKKLLVRIITPS